MTSTYTFHTHKFVAIAILLLLLLLLLLLAASSASAAGVLTTRALGGYLTGEAEYILQVITLLTFLIGLALILIGSWWNNSWVKTKGYQAVGGVVVIVILYFTVPGIVGTISSLSTESTVFEFGGGSANNSSGFGGGGY